MLTMAIVSIGLIWMAGGIALAVKGKVDNDRLNSAISEVGVIVDGEPCPDYHAWILPHLRLVQSRMRLFSFIIGTLCIAVGLILMILPLIRLIRDF